MSDISAAETLNARCSRTHTHTKRYLGWWCGNVRACALWARTCLCACDRCASTVKRESHDGRNFTRLVVHGRSRKHGELEGM